jgi:endonuclease-3
MNADARTKTILSLLKKSYPDAHIALKYTSPWELLVSVILSAQCTDVMVNKVTKTLFQQYPSIDSFAKASTQEIEASIKPTGFYHNKAKHILESAKIIQKKFQNKVPNSMKDILTLPGVARKTANVVLGNAYGIVEGIAVDTHVLRLTQRLRLVSLDAIGGRKKFFIKASHVHRPMSDGIDFIKDASPEKIESELMKIIPKPDWFSLTYELIDHGRLVCKAQNPKCDICILKKICPSSRA